MALSKLEPDRKRAEQIAIRMKEIIETTWLRDPSLNDKEAAEYLALKTEVESMGLYVHRETSLDFSDPAEPKIKAEITLLIPKNGTTIH